MDSSTPTTSHQISAPPVSRPWAIAGGFAMILLGFFAIGDQLLFTALTANLIGILLMFGCAVQIMKVFTITGWKSHLWYLLVAVAYDKGAAWVFFSALMSLILGGLIIAQWPYTGLYILGLFLGIELIFAGAGWLGLGLSSPKKQ